MKEPSFLGLLNTFCKLPASLLRLSQSASSFACYKVFLPGHGRPSQRRDVQANSCHCFERTALHCSCTDYAALSLSRLIQFLQDFSTVKKGTNAGLRKLRAVAAFSNVGCWRAPFSRVFGNLPSSAPQRMNVQMRLRTALLCNAASHIIPPSAPTPRRQGKDALPGQRLWQAHT